MGHYDDLPNSHSENASVENDARACDVSSGVPVFDLTEGEEVHAEGEENKCEQESQGQVEQGRALSCVFDPDPASESQCGDGYPKQKDVEQYKHFALPEKVLLLGL